MIFVNKGKLSIQIEREKVTRREIYKYLGFYFDSQFGWKEHVTKRTYAKVGFKLRRKERALSDLTSLRYSLSTVS